MKDFKDLVIPPLDAEAFFNDTANLNNIFYKSSHYEKILKPTTYYLLGDKGSGKTMYSAYFCSQYSTEINASNFPIKVDDYKKFIQMKKNGELDFTDYETIWKVILLIKILISIDKNEIKSLFKGNMYKKIDMLSNMFNITEVTKDAFSPSIAVDNREIIEELTNDLSGQINISPSSISSKLASTSMEKNFQSVQYTQYRYVDKWTAFLNDATYQLKDIRLKKPHYLFIDGIDLRPSEISYADYKECVSALLRAVYDINHQMFSKIKNKDEGRLQIVALSRLDIFLESELSNVGCKVVDNSIFLNWSLSNLKDIKNSDIYRLMNNILAQDETDKNIDMWKHYMNFDIKRIGGCTYDSFEYCMRLTASRPRDFIRILQLLQEIAKNDKQRRSSMADYFNMDNFHKQFSTYYVDSIKSEMSFYHKKEEIKLFFNFMKTFNSLSFTYEQFKKKVDEFYNKEELLRIYGNKLDVLKSMYNLNIICLVENNNMYRWKYRETTIDNYEPDLADYNIQENTKFIFHWAVEKAFSVYPKPKRDSRY